jgi:uridine kinase
MLAVALRLIEQHRRSRSHLLVAIDGGGGAGKSTLARNLADALGDATIVQMDDFYRPMPAAERRL